MENSEREKKISEMFTVADEAMDLLAVENRCEVWCEEVINKVQIEKKKKENNVYSLW